jgi:hypothetical protein
MTVELKWNPRQRAIKLLVRGHFTLEDLRDVNDLIGEICAYPDFIHGYLLVHMENVQRPSYTPLEGFRNTTQFRGNNLRLMVVSGLPAGYQMLARTFRPIIEQTVGMPVRFVNTMDEAVSVIDRLEGKSSDR